MGYISNVRSLAGGLVGIGGGPLGVAGWVAKTATPNGTPAVLKGLIGIGASAFAAAGTYYLTSGAFDVGGFAANFRFLGGAVTDWESAGITALFTGASFCVSPGYDRTPRASKADAKPPKFVFPSNVK